ncbi:hypothetical protein [Sulfurisphaera ohwakuensis]|uniref:hypothetical protein n=1 Tax=Sulfurisphaera ohwakuensis TaxID=69656 RepID=UPI0036F3CD4C
MAQLEQEEKIASRREVFFNLTHTFVENSDKLHVNVSINGEDILSDHSMYIKSYAEFKDVEALLKEIKRLFYVLEYDVRTEKAKEELGKEIYIRIAKLVYMVNETLGW